MTPNVDETIAAIASAPGVSMRGILRISGRDTGKHLGQAFKLSDSDFEQLVGAKRCVRLNVTLQLEPDFEIESQVLFWPNRQSYTRQPSAELHCCGSPALLQLMLDKLFDSGCRRAEPGEFTMRAFLAGRLDLAQAEAVMGLIDARDRRQFEASFSQLAGGIGGPIAKARDLLIALLAELEAGLDFVEEDIEFISQVQLTQQLEQASQQIDQLLLQIRQRHHHWDRLAVVLVGRPNVGKSSLFNKLTAGNAIVSDQEGTTRDYIRASLDCEGQQIELFDTAGVGPDSAMESIEQLMYSQTTSAIDKAHLKVLCRESGSDPDEWERSLMESPQDTLIVAWTKCDLDYDPTIPAESGVQTSAVRALGLTELKEQIATRVGQMIHDQDGASSTIARSAESLSQAAKSLQIAQNSVHEGMSEELIAAEVRNALDHLGRVVGKIYTDDILDQVFSRFCIGK